MISLLYGGITHHYLGSNLPYCNRLNNSGTIHNEYIIAMIGNEKTKFGILKGKDSACGNIIGPIASFNFAKNTDFVIGGYNTNYSKFYKLGIEPPSINGVTPILGFDYRIPLVKTKNTKITLDNLISIGIITHSLRMDF